MTTIPNLCRIVQKWNEHREIESRNFLIGSSANQIDVEISTVRRTREDLLACVRMKSVQDSRVFTASMDD